MKNNILTPILVASAFLVTGGTVLSVALLTNKDNLVVTNDHIVDQPFSNINIVTDNANVTFIKSEDLTVKAVYTETKKDVYTLEVKDDTLNIVQTNKRSFIQNLSYQDDINLFIYMPVKEFVKLNVTTNDGFVSLPKELTFNESLITSSSGTINYESTINYGATFMTEKSILYLNNVKCNTLGIRSTAGNVYINNTNVNDETTISSKSADISTDKLLSKTLTIENENGHTKLNNTIASSKLEIIHKGGDIDLINVDSNALSLSTKTGDINGTLLSGKTFDVTSTYGEINVPENEGDELCLIVTTSGDVNIEIKEQNISN